MPIYVYRCKDCGETTDAFGSLDSPVDPIACEHCGGKNTHRVIGSVAYHASNNAKTARLDPKYGKLVDDAMRKSAGADLDHLLKRMKPFGGAKDE